MPPAEKAAFLRIQDVVKEFDGFKAVKNVSLDIAKGEIFALLGSSGCGKSTLLRMLAGFEVPTSGRIVLDGVDLADMPPYRRPMNMMFQSYALFPHLTVWQNIAFGLQREQLPKERIAARVEAMLKLVQLGPYAQRKPHQLSGGQQQRVALARSLAKQPQLLLLDEPLGALDKKLREETQFELKDLQAELGMTFLIVTHDQEEAMTMDDRIGVMNEGRIVQTARPEVILERTGRSRKRPLLETKDREQKIRELLAARAPLFRLDDRSADAHGDFLSGHDQKSCPDHTVRDVPRHARGMCCKTTRSPRSTEHAHLQPAPPRCACSRSPRSTVVSRGIPHGCRGSSLTVGWWSR